jgi:signal transduction histidine kinase
MKPPARSSAAADPPAASESRPSDGRDLGAAFAHAVERADFGFVWCDADLIVRRRHGRIVDFVPLDRPLTESVLALFGMEAQVKALRRKPQMTIEVPNVSIVAADGATPRLNLQVTWQPRRRHFLLLVSRVMSISELEVELTRHARERQIMEARLVESAEAIARANAELTRANRELAEFAYVISHDLKAPMRAMRYFTEDLENALPEAERAGVREHLAKVREQSRRMSQMLTDLLAYSKIGRKEEAVEVVDTRALVGSITQSMPRPEGLALDVVGHWPRVETAPAPLDLVLRNLIENAIKHHDTGEGRVSAACRPSGRQLLIDIADDGPGIEPRHQSIIFQPFQRLAPDRPVDGSGIGLALVRKTVECCGATLTVSSAPAERRGATFRVTWPCQVIE